MRTAVRRRHRVAIRREETVVARDPGDRPFERAVTFSLLDAAGEDIVGDGLLSLYTVHEKVLEPAGEVERGALRRLAVACKLCLGARPSDLDAAEEIGLGARHGEESRRLEGSAFAEDLGVWPEAHARAAAVLDRPESLHRPVGRAARIALPVELLPARHLDLHMLRQRIGDRNADAVQPAARLVDLGVEFAPRMQRGHDDFECGLLLEFRMGIDRNAAAVIRHRKIAIFGELDLDARSVAGNRLVHGVVQHLGEEVMHRLLVGAADIHAGAPADRLEPFQHLDVCRRVGVLATLGGRLGGGGRFRAFDRLLLQLVLELGE